MRRIFMAAAAVALCGWLAAPTAAQSDKVEYVPAWEYQVFVEMDAYADSVQALRDSVTDEIRERQEELKETEEAQEQKLLLDFSKIETPVAPEVFDAVFHFPPVAQYLTGTCWSFAGTSFLETEAERLTGRKIKLSEMFTVYWEWVERARRFVAERGDSRVGQGSQTNAVLRVFKKYGAVPLADYSGLPDPAYERHHHGPLSQEIKDYLSLLEENDLWDEDAVIAVVRLILDKHLGRPPETVTFEGVTYTPREFVNQVLGLNGDDYATVMSTMAEPFYTRAEFKVYDNWWHDSSYYNVPLDEWYATIKKAVNNGYSVTIGGDNSEPGVNGFVDAAVIADYDIPQKYINQHSREFRLDNRTTSDDHGIHLVGYKKIGGRDWYLIKDSSSRARYGKYKGYMFYRGDFVRLKMMTFTVHKDAMEGLLEKFAGTAK
ncbi:C1 family peptidase [Candidatus Zixiibacteriota bacterium]